MWLREKERKRNKEKEKFINAGTYGVGFLNSRRPTPFFFLSFSILDLHSRRHQKSILSSGDLYVCGFVPFLSSCVATKPNQKKKSSSSGLLMYMSLRTYSQNGERKREREVGWLVDMIMNFPSFYRFNRERVAI
jgi:hypothetical protein